MMIAYRSDHDSDHPDSGSKFEGVSSMIQINVIMV